MKVSCCLNAKSVEVLSRRDLPKVNAENVTKHVGEDSRGWLQDQMEH